MSVVVLVPGTDRVECRIEHSEYNLSYFVDNEVRDDLILYSDEVLALALLHPDVKKLVEWAKSTIGNTNTVFEKPGVWTEGKCAIGPFEEENNG